MPYTPDALNKGPIRQRLRPACSSTRGKRQCSVARHGREQSQRSMRKRGRGNKKQMRCGNAPRRSNSLLQAFRIRRRELCGLDRGGRPVCGKKAARKRRGEGTHVNANTRATDSGVTVQSTQKSTHAAPRARVARGAPVRLQAPLSFQTSHSKLARPGKRPRKGTSQPRRTHTQHREHKYEDDKRTMVLFLVVRGQRPLSLSGHQPFENRAN